MKNASELFADRIDAAVRYRANNVKVDTGVAEQVLREIEQLQARIRRQTALIVQWNDKTLLQKLVAVLSGNANVL